MLPPGVIFLLLLLALLLWRWWPGAARRLVWGALLTLVLLSMPGVSLGLMSLLCDGLEPVTEAQILAFKPQAIVVLGGGRDQAAPEFGGADTVSAATLQRLRYAARLQQQTGLPLLVSGGRVFDEVDSEATLMAQVLVGELHVPVRWQEGASKTTAENAAATAELLHGQGISRILLVTHSWHMPRSLYVFGLAGLEALPAATAFPNAEVPSGSLLQWLPRASALATSSQALHEWIGLLQYRWQYRNAGLPSIGAQ